MQANHGEEASAGNIADYDGAKVMPHHCGLPAQMHQAEEKLRELRSGSKLVTGEERAAVDSAFLAATEAWAKRKRMFKSIWCAAALSGHLLQV